MICGFCVWVWLNGGIVNWFGLQNATSLTKSIHRYIVVCDITWAGVLKETLTISKQTSGDTVKRNEK